MFFIISVLIFEGDIENVHKGSPKGPFLKQHEIILLLRNLMNKLTITQKNKWTSRWGCWHARNGNVYKARSRWALLYTRHNLHENKAQMITNPTANHGESMSEYFYWWMERRSRQRWFGTLKSGCTLGKNSNKNGGKSLVSWFNYWKFRI